MGREGYFFGADKEAIEVRAATQLDAAMSAARVRLEALRLGRSDRLALSELLCDTLVLLPETASVQVWDRGNARRLCASLRLWAETLTNLSELLPPLMRVLGLARELRNLCKWAMHPPAVPAGRRRAH